jgi:hypothetical protein
MGRLSRTVVVGRVVSSSSRWVAPAPGKRGHGSIVTVTRLRLVTAIKGRPGRLVAVVTPGGRVGAVRQVVDETPIFTPGRRCIVFLDARGRVIAAREGVLDVVGGAVPGGGGGGAPGRAPPRRIARAAGVALTSVSPGAAGATSGGTVGGASAGRLTTVRRTPAAVRTVRRPIAAADAPWNGDATLPRLGSPVNLLTDGFESGFAWTATTFNTSGPTTTWGRSNARASAGGYSAYCAQSGSPTGPPYPNGMDGFMYEGPFDLTGGTVAHLDFDLWLNGESAGDYCSYLVTYQGAAYWSGTGWSTATAGWVHKTIDLSSVPDGSGGTVNLIGRSGVYVGFEFRSNVAVVGEGAYVDQVSVTKDTPVGGPTVSAISPSSAGAGVNVPVTITGTGFGASQGTGSVNFYYDGTKTIAAPVSSWSDTQIVCTVPTATIDGYPASAGTGPITVTSGAGVTGPSYSGFTVTFAYGGSKWSTPGMTFQVNPNCADATDEVALADAGAFLWNPPSAFLFADGGTTTATAYNNNSHNEIFWGNDLPAGVLAQATYWFSGGVVHETDVEFNDAYTWGDGTTAGVYDVQSIASHELGHALNLRDLYGPGDTTKIMYGFATAGRQKHALDPGDQAGIVWIYGARPAMSGALTVDGDAAFTAAVAATLDSSVQYATQMRFSNDGAAWGAWEPYAAVRSGWSLAAGDGAKTVFAQYRDAGGNVLGRSDAIVLDTTAPVTGALVGDGRPLDGATWHAGPLTVTLSASDPPAGDGSRSGMSGGAAGTQYSSDGGATWAAGTNILFARWKRGGGSGTWTVFSRSTDAAGNLEQPSGQMIVKIANSLPAASDDAPATPQSGTVTVHLRGLDGDSGVAWVWYWRDGGQWTQVAYPGGVGVPVSVSGLGVHTLCYYAVDNVGNREVGYRVCAVTILGP